MIFVTKILLNILSLNENTYWVKSLKISMQKNLTLTSIWYKGLGQAWGIGCGSIGIAVTSDTRDPWFESSN